MHVPAQSTTEHRIYFQAFYEAAGLSNFLLRNRLRRVQRFIPALSQLIVVIQGPRTVKPHHVTTLACLLEEYRLAGIAISFEDGGSVVYPYLHSIGFFERWTHTDYESSTSFIVSPDSTSFILWKAAQEHMTSYARSAHQHYHSNFFAGKDLSSLEAFLAEIFNNVCDHAFASSNKRIAFGMLQYYPSRRRLFVAVSDFGMGIPASVNGFLRKEGLEQLSTLDALRKALEFRFTSQSQPRNQGRGLDILRTGLRGLGGTLTIQTSHSIYHVSENGKEIFHSIPAIDFPGTTVSLRMFYETLRPEETDIMEEDVDLF